MLTAEWAVLTVPREAASAVNHSKVVATAGNLSVLVELRDECGGLVEVACESVLYGAEGVSDDHTVVVVVQWEVGYGVG